MVSDPKIYNPQILSESACNLELFEENKLKEEEEGGKLGINHGSVGPWLISLSVTRIFH
ncbi:Uncharacterized protein FKW44_006938 [Caligus rogercresseyi]|uniref:Uncharacterized protein n=1 Tax=Caligus rogercresseyi TaxID=217165 RepID=A0A7T8QT61_CALRO|nr:Uncharacterized protein FKW44_006938 [Caligus rogercresseyi]